MINKLLILINEPNESGLPLFSALAQLLTLNTELVCLQPCDRAWMCSHVHVHVGGLRVQTLHRLIASVPTFSYTVFIQTQHAVKHSKRRTMEQRK